MASRYQRLKKPYVEPIQITSLLDVLIVICFFLLELYAAEPPYMANSELQLPASTAQQPLKLAAKIVASKNAVSVGVTRVATICGGMLYYPDVECSPQGQPSDPNKMFKTVMIEPLQKALSEEAENQKALAKLRPDKPFEGHLILEAHHELKFLTLRPLMFTAGQSEFGLFKFVVRKTDK